MDELLKQLLEAEVLSQSTKDELETAFSLKINEAVEEASNKAAEDAKASVTVELTEAYLKDKELLIEALDNKVDEFLLVELEAIKEDIEDFRDLEKEHAENLVEAKEDMAKELDEEIKELAEKLDVYLELRLGKEMDELKEDIEEAKQNAFGKKLFEAFENEYKSSYADEDSIAGTLRETEEQLVETALALEELNELNESMERDNALRVVLEPLNGQPKKIMEAILKNTPTEKLEESYGNFISRVLVDSNDDNSEKETKVLAESVKKEVVIEGVEVSGDSKTLLERNEIQAKVNAEVSEEILKRRADMKALAGI